MHPFTLIYHIQFKQNKYDIVFWTWGKPKRERDVRMFLGSAQWKYWNLILQFSLQMMSQSVDESRRYLMELKSEEKVFVFPLLGLTCVCSPLSDLPECWNRRHIQDPNTPRSTRRRVGKRKSPSLRMNHCHVGPKRLRVWFTAMSVGLNSALKGNGPTESWL